MANPTLLALVAVWLLLTVGLPLLYCARQRNARAHYIGLGVGIPAGVVLYLLLMVVYTGGRLDPSGTYDSDWHIVSAWLIVLSGALGAPMGANAGPAIATRMVGSPPRRRGVMPGLLLSAVSLAGVVCFSVLVLILTDDIAGGYAPLILMLAATAAAPLALLGGAIGGLCEAPEEDQSAADGE